MHFVKDQARQESVAGFGPVIGKPLAFGINDDVDEVLRVADFVQCAEPYFFKRVECNRSAFGSGIEANDGISALACPPSGGQVEQLVLHVIQDHAAGP